MSTVTQTYDDEQWQLVPKQIPFGTLAACKVSPFEWAHVLANAPTLGVSGDESSLSVAMAALQFYAKGQHFYEGMECFGGGATVRDFGDTAQKALSIIEAALAAAPTPELVGAKACGAFECKAGQADGLICPDESCDIEDGVRAPIAAPTPAVQAQSVPVAMTDAEVEDWAHRNCFKYAHSNDPSMRQYTFGPLTLHNFVRGVLARAAVQGARNAMRSCR